MWLTNAHNIYNILGSQSFVLESEYSFVGFVLVFVLGGEGVLRNKPVQGLRLTNHITGFMPNQLKIDRSLYQLGD